MYKKGSTKTQRRARRPRQLTRAASAVLRLIRSTISGSELGSLRPRLVMLAAPLPVGPLA